MVCSTAVTGVYYHFGVASSDSILKRLAGVKAVVMAGSGGRIGEFALRWWSQRRVGDHCLPQDDRFVTRYTAGVLFASHGMGMPSASIALQELMRMVFFLKRGDLQALDEVFWCRVGGTSGDRAARRHGRRQLRGPDGRPAAVPADQRRRRRYWFDGHFPVATYDAIIAANEHTDFEIVSGKTVAGNEFFLEQFRLDGAICLETPETKMGWLRWLHENGVANIEMEGAMIAGYLNHWGFSRFAMICCTLLNRLGATRSPPARSSSTSSARDSGAALFNYLAASLLGA